MHLYLVLEKTRYLYDGTRRSPWNEIECGDHYTRPMSSFALFAIASGQVNKSSFISLFFTLSFP